MRCLWSRCFGMHRVSCCGSWWALLFISWVTDPHRPQQEALKSAADDLRAAAESWQDLLHCTRMKSRRVLLLDDLQLVRFVQVRSGGVVLLLPLNVCAAPLLPRHARSRLLKASAFGPETRRLCLPWPQHCSPMFSCGKFDKVVAH